VDSFNKKNIPLHILINNAGIMATPFSLTKDGYEIQWGTNVVGHFLFTKALLPILEATSVKYPPGTVRVINVSSYGHNMAPKGGIDFENIKLENHSTWTRYGQSKLGNILLTKEITRRYGDKGIYSIAIHPGSVKTELIRGPQETAGKFLSTILYPLTWLFLNGLAISAKQGAITQLYAATSPEVIKKELNGKYLIPYCKEYEPSEYAKDSTMAKKLWDILDKETQGKL